MCCPCTLVSPQPHRALPVRSALGCSGCGQGIARALPLMPCARRAQATLRCRRCKASCAARPPRCGTLCAQPLWLSSSVPVVTRTPWPRLSPAPRLAHAGAAADARPVQRHAGEAGLPGARRARCAACAPPGRAAARRRRVLTRSSLKAASLTAERRAGDARAGGHGDGAQRVPRAPAPEQARPQRRRGRAGHRRAPVRRHQHGRALQRANVRPALPESWPAARLPSVQLKSNVAHCTGACSAAGGMRPGRSEPAQQASL
jgi:hypothetical protein